MSVHMVEAVRRWRWVPEAAVPMNAPGRSSIHQWDLHWDHDSSHPPMTQAVTRPLAVWVTQEILSSLSRAPNDCVFLLL